MGTVRRPGRRHRNGNGSRLAFRVGMCDHRRCARILSSRLELAQVLLRHKAATKIVPLETISRLRQSKPNFDARGCREVGKMAGADQVLWIEVQDFRASEQIEDAMVAAYFTVTLKVINVNAIDRSQVRLWPTAPQGRRVTITLTGSQVSIAKTKNGIVKKLTSKLASQIAKFFYDFRLGDFERAP